MDELLDLHAAGGLAPSPAAATRSSDARQAHEDIGSRRTLGKLVLDPSRLTRAACTAHRPPRRPCRDRPGLHRAAAARARRRRAEPGTSARCRARRLPARAGTRPAAEPARRPTRRHPQTARTRLRRRVVHDGSWGFASHVDLTPESAGGSPSRQSRWPRSAPASTAADRARRRAVLRRRHLGLAYDVDPFSVPDPDKVALLADWSAGCSPTTSSTTSTRRVHSVMENKFYADLAGTTTTQQRVRMHPRARGRRHRQGVRPLRHHAHPCAPVGRGWEYLTGTGWDWAAELAELPELLAEKLRAPSVEAGDYDLVIDPSQPVAHHPRVDRARDRARPCAGLRGQLRGHVVRDLRQARHAAATAPRS